MLVERFTAASTAYNNFGYSGGAVTSMSYGPQVCNPLGFQCQYNITVVGIISGKDSNYNTFYTHIRYAMQDFGLQIVTE